MLFNVFNSSISRSDIAHVLLLVVKSLLIHLLLESLYCSSISDLVFFKIFYGILSKINSELELFIRFLQLAKLTHKKSGYSPSKIDFG